MKKRERERKREGLKNVRTACFIIKAAFSFASLYSYSSQLGEEVDAILSFLETTLDVTEGTFLALFTLRLCCHIFFTMIVCTVRRIQDIRKKFDTFLTAFSSGTQKFHHLFSLYII